jgi:hypothetical protein
MIGTVSPPPEGAGPRLVLEAEPAHFLQQGLLLTRDPVRVDQHVDVLGQGRDGFADSIEP